MSAVSSGATGAERMKKFLLATVSMVALTSVTRAADMAGKAPAYVPAPMVNWSGGYIGVEGGVAQSRGRFSNTDGFVDLPEQFDKDKTGGTVGGLLGYNWQQSSVVYGVEGDWNWIGAKATAVDAISFRQNSAATSFNVPWLATLRGRVGVALDTTLVYVTGGVAFGQVKNSVELRNDPDDGLSTTFALDQTKVGWTAGAGVEHMLSQHWTARAEFRYADLGKTTVACGGANFDGCASLGPSGAYRGEFSNRLMLGLVGVAYKF
jgi:outer membrane immunogenic protein